MLLGLALGAAASASPLAAQAIPRPEYVTYLPRFPLQAIAETDASARFNLFGDTASSSYRDTSPRNGIGDAQDSLFLALGLRFAPWLVRNAYGFPMDLGRLIREHDVPLVQDLFNLARGAPEVLRSDTLHLARGTPAPCAVASPASGDTGEDCRLLHLLLRRGPQAQPERPEVRPTLDPEEVLYLDLPGDSPRTWAQEYGGRRAEDVSPAYLGYAKSYLHPFITTVDGPGGSPRFELVLQYWFYYPTNDAGNVHEGDFEHINVIIAPRERVTEALDSDILGRILAGRVPIDSLVIRRVEYYFHHWVLPVDYSRPNVYASREAWEREVQDLLPTRVGERDIWQAIRFRAYLDDAESRLNLHPLVYIGGDGRGLGLLLKSPNALGASSHGSYPFPGLYRSVGPAGTGESINQPWDAHRSAPAATAPESTRVIRYDNHERLELLPDWERLLPLALTSPDIRWTWAWFLLPAHTGYPATVSPFAGVVRYAETGNVPPGAPIYNGGWNRTGDGAGYTYYLPQRLSSLFPYALQDTYDSRWGFLNGTLPTIGLLPPFDVLYRVIQRPVTRLFGNDQPMYSRTEDLPARRVSLGVGGMRFATSSDFGFLAGFPEISTPLLRHAVALTGSLAGIGLGEATFDPMVGWRGEISLHLGDRFTSTNGLAHGRSSMRQELFIAGFPNEPLTAELNYWEYTGTLRYNLSRSAIQPFVMGGYGLSWYRLEDYAVSDSVLGDTRWVRKPGLFHNLLPNTWHLGVGIEALPSYGFGKLNVGIKATAGLHLNNLGLETGNNTTVFFQNKSLHRWVVALVATAGI